MARIGGDGRDGAVPDLATIRAACPADAPAVAAIWNQVIRDTTHTFWPTPRPVADIAALIRDRQSAGHAFLVADRAGVVTGFSTTTQFRGGAGYAHSLEHTVYVDPAAIGAGTGRALMGAVEDHARSQGARVLIGAITASNAASLAFHARLGFCRWAHIPDAGWKFGRFHDLILMGKRLGT